MDYRLIKEMWAFTVVLLGEVARSYADLRGFQLRLDIAAIKILAETGPHPQIASP